MSQPLYVAFVWHMHQPTYKDFLTGRYSLPWVRLHGIRDYLHMAEVLREFPGVHATFNVVPTLAAQLLEYARGEAADQCLTLSRKQQWTRQEKAFLLSFFFHVHRDRIIQPIPRYRQLLEIGQQARDDPDLLSDAYYRDLVAWFNLAWIDPNWRERHPELHRLAEKGRDFSFQDIETILAIQQEILARIVPTYREMEAAGQIEITTTPYYHPILPLLIHTDHARRASPNLPLPTPPFSHPEDAEEQLRRAVEFHAQVFGRPPRGLWPSEGAVCQEMLPYLPKLGLRWLASDEDVLARSLGLRIERDGGGHVTNPRVLYRPYRARAGPNSVDIVFRDHVLSDRIGFVYQHMEGRQAVADLLHRLHRVRENLGDPEGAYLVSIILDGENCWDEYEHNGGVFLRHLYGGIQEDDALLAVTVSEFLERSPPDKEIPQLATGSWIGGNLETWIGEAAQNQAWGSLRRTRDHLIAWQREALATDLEVLAQAWEELYIAEGSDWFWWYYSRNNPGADNLFDQEFREHLANVYRLMGVPVPGWLREPILVSPAQPPRQAPRGLLSPPLTATPTAPPAWAQAGYVEPELSKGTMQRAASHFRRLYYGFDRQNLYFRLELADNLPHGAQVAFYLSAPFGKGLHPAFPLEASLGETRVPAVPVHWEIRFNHERALLRKAIGQGVWEESHTLPHAGAGNVREVAVPLDVTGVSWGELVSAFALLVHNGVAIEALPASEAVDILLQEPSPW